MRHPEVTVVIPTRNRWADLSSAALPAALAQEHVEVEVVVVDDGSVDETPRAVAALNEPRLRTLRNDAPHGVARARNRGLAEARAEWVAFLDDDDLWSPHKLRVQLDVAATGADVVYTGGVITDRGGVPQRDSPAPSTGTLAIDLARRNVIGGPSAVMARTALLRTLGGFDERFSVFADWELWIRLTRAGRPAACDDRLVAFREHGSNMSGLDVDEAYAELAALVELHGVSVDLTEFARWVAWQQRRLGRRVPAVRAYLRGARVGRSVGLLLRAAATPFGEGAMGIPARVRGALGRPDSLPPSPDWIERYRPGLAAEDL